MVTPSPLTVTTSGTTPVLAENWRPLIVIVTAVLPVVMGIVAPDTARLITVGPAMLGVTNAEPMLKTSMPDDATEKELPKVTLREVATAVFIKNESTTLLQGPVLQELTAAEVTIKPDRGPVGDPVVGALSIVVETVMPVSEPAVCTPVVSPVTVTVCAPAASGPVPASVMTPELKLKKV